MDHLCIIINDLVFQCMNSDSDSDSDSDIYLFDHIITNILHNYQFCLEYKRVIGYSNINDTFN